MLWLLAPTALALGLRFPTSDADHGYFYPTAYYDQGGVDWACGGITYSGHRGSDFGVGGFDGMYAGREIVAAAEGVVLATNDGAWDECTTGDCDGGGGYGNYVWLQHPDGTQTIYAHMRQWTVAVSTGQSVACGEYLGEVGSSGYSTGPHLHFEVREADGSTRRDPFAGACSSSTSSWVDQGDYGDLPAPVCEDVPPCSTLGTLSCGDVVSTRNDAVSAASSHGFYGCDGWTYTGPEVAWQVVTDLDETVTVRLTGLSADLDLYVLEDAACDATGCLGSSDEPDGSDEVVSFGAAAGHAYVVVVDGYEGAVSDLVLSVECSGSLPDQGGTDTGPQGDGGAQGDGGSAGDGGTGWTPDTSDDPAPGQPLGRLVDPATLEGCSAVPLPVAGGWLLGLLALSRRRR